MSAPQASMMAQLARAHFASLGIKLPTDWQTPTGKPACEHYVDTFKPEERAVPPPTGSPPLFITATANEYHTQAAQRLSDDFTAFIDGICDAICKAWQTWQSSAVLTGVTINSVIASGGQVKGPPWKPLILGVAPKQTAMQRKYSQAVASTIGQGWQSYESSLGVPGLPWYPAFAAVPAPVAPPQPNLPMPVAALAQVTASLGKSVLKQQMCSALGDAKATHHEALFDSLADAFATCFALWQSATMVTNVMGTGPVPSFAPPFVPVGPVVSGSGNMIPGGFA